MSFRQLLRTGVLLAALASAAASRHAAAGKPSGGGGGPPPAGTLYFVDRGTGVTWAMDGAGGSRSATGLETAGATGTYRPSRLLHGGTRWFLHLEVVSGETGPGGTARQDVFLIREDGGVRLRLTSDPTLAYRYQCEWGSDEDSSGATIAFLAAEWTGTTATDTVLTDTVGVYTARLSFDSDGAPLGLDAEPAFSTPLPLHGTAGKEVADVVNFLAWSPDRTRIAFNRATDSRTIWMVDVATGALTAVGPGEAPDWSPDGSRIACHRYIEGSKPKTAIETVRADGTGRVTVYSLNTWKSPHMTQNVFGPQWSPDGAYLAYVYSTDDHHLNFTNWIYRIAPDGSGNTNLTPEVVSGSGFAGAWLRDWR